ncbi:MAG: imidazole glycerol phosphate synthase, glutamine amidotransferase subunit [Coxiella sp. RIFCSPHIGHO2_12_FULL_44_14]|nr:MAG: imidazole glycerol phosphate synthase, glutamine amidotransferase subunit [Coxiella sp. RIFCSPHIGHO2_12_FULL_44_14]
MKIGIVDYGLANTRSVMNAVECLGAHACLASRGEDLSSVDRIILPGVGSFDAAMQALQTRGHISVLNQRVVNEHIPFLGICLGLQLLFESSEEGVMPGLGWIKGSVCALAKSTVKVPHMGWNEIVVCRENSLFLGIDTTCDVYFVHSYYVPYEEDAAQYCVAYCDYGQRSVAALEQGSIFGVQFHPEKSQLTGMKILENFLKGEAN